MSAGQAKRGRSPLSVCVPSKARQAWQGSSTNGGAATSSTLLLSEERSWVIDAVLMGRRARSMARRTTGRRARQQLDAPRVREGLVDGSTRHMGRKLGRRAMENSHTCDRIQRGDEQFRATKRERWHTR